MEVKGRFTLRNYPMGQTHHTLLGKEEVLKKKKKKKKRKGWTLAARAEPVSLSSEKGGHE